MGKAAAQSRLRPVLPPGWQHGQEGRRGPWVAPIASGIVPGSGQFLRGESRGAVYVVAEVYLLQRFLSLWSEGHRQEDNYRDLALKVARASFGPVFRDTVFEYFEQMGRYAESGPFDTDLGPPLAPPTDESTYNGAIWALARRTYFTGPTPPPDTSVSYQAAVAFYRSRAIGPNYQWSWRDASVERDLFRQSIREGDEAFRRATRQLGLLLANHFLSAVDAFVSDRLSRRGRSIRLDHALLPPTRKAGPGMVLRVEIGF